MYPFFSFFFCFVLYSVLFYLFHFPLPNSLYLTYKLEIPYIYISNLY